MDVYSITITERPVEIKKFTSAKYTFPESISCSKKIYYLPLSNQLFYL